MGKMKLNKYSPNLNPEITEKEWLNRPGSPKPFRADNEPKTIPYDELIETWINNQNGK